MMRRAFKLPHSFNTACNEGVTSACMRFVDGIDDAERVDALEQQFLRNHVTEDVLFATGRGVAPWMASVTFGGSDLRTLYIGSLKGKRIPYFRVPVPGLPMVHWKEN